MTATTTPIADASATDDRGRSDLIHTARQITVITKRNLLRYARLPQLIVFATVQPVMFLLLFNFVFGGAIGAGSNGKYINFLLPGLLVQTSLFGAAQTTIGLTEDLASGSIDRFRSLPIARSAVLAGRTLSDLLRNIFVMILMVVVGLLLGFRLGGNIGQGLLAFVIVLAFGFSFSWVMAGLGLAVKNAEAAQAAGFLVIFPLAFASSVFVPPETMPGWLQAFTKHQPVTVVADAVRGLTVGAVATTTILHAIAWIIGIFLVAFPIAVGLYRRASQ